MQELVGFSRSVSCGALSLLNHDPMSREMFLWSSKAVVDILSSKRSHQRSSFSPGDLIALFCLQSKKDISIGFDTKGNGRIGSTQGSHLSPRFGLGCLVRRYGRHGVLGDGAEKAWTMLYVILAEAAGDASSGADVDAESASSARARDHNNLVNYCDGTHRKHRGSFSWLRERAKRKRTLRS